MPTPPKKAKPRNPRLKYESASDKHVSWHNSVIDGVAPVHILCGGYGSSKTHSTALMVLHLLLGDKKFAGENCLVVGLTNSHNRNLILPGFKKSYLGITKMELLVDLLKVRILKLSQILI